MVQAQMLRRQGHKIFKIAEMLNVKERTIYNYLNGKVFKEGEKRGRPKGSPKLKDFIGHINEKLDLDFHLNAETLFTELVNMGYKGKITILRDYIQRRREEIRKVAVFRFETLPGHQAQVDWAHAGYFHKDGKKRKRYLFVMKLGYSRRSYMEFTYGMSMPIFLACHLRAFIYFGGIPEEILYDNMKTAFLYHAEEARWYAHPKLLQFARHYGYVPRRCRIRRPQTKGKVEREIRYFRFSFLRSAGDIRHIDNEKMNERLLEWLERVDNKVLRDFGRTRLERFAEDLKKMRELPTVQFEYRRPEPLKVSREGTFTYKTNKYSIHADYLNKMLTGLREPDGNQMEIYDGKHYIKTVSLQPDGARVAVIDPADRESLLKVWKRGRQWEQEQARRLIERKKMRAKVENYVQHPEIYDKAFNVCEEEVLV
jgi:transposase